MTADYLWQDGDPCAEGCDPAQEPARPVVDVDTGGRT